MKLAGQRWRTLVSTVTLGGKSYRLLRPAYPMAHAPLDDGAGSGAPQIVVDKAAAVELACAWWLAARSPNSLIHLPLRQATDKCGSWIEGRPSDLVLMHHSLQFPVKQWKEIRGRATSWTPHTVRFPAQPFPEITQANHDRRWHRRFHDHLLWETAADTLFVIGSRPAFELASNQVRELAEGCPAHIAQTPDAHCCAEIEIGRTLRYEHRNPVHQASRHLLRDSPLSPAWTAGHGVAMVPTALQYVPRRQAADLIDNQVSGLCCA